jgi:hypothetical protein
LLLAPVLLYAAWVSYPPSRYEALSVTILQEVAARHAAEQQVAHRADLNAYVDPFFLPFWGREGIELRDPSPAGEALKGLEDLSDLAQGRDVKLEKRLKDPAVHERFKQFALVYPHFREMCNRPHLVVPSSQPTSFPDPEPQYIAFRKIPLLLSGYAEYLSLQGQSEQALSVAMDCLRFSHLILAEQPALIRSMIGAAAQQISQSTLAMLLETPLPGEALEPLLQLLQQTQVPASTFSACIETEYAQGVEMLSGMKKPFAGQNASWIPLPPGLEGRELRLYKNDFLAVVVQLRQGQPIQNSWATNFKMLDWFLGRHGVLGAIAIANYTKTGSHYEVLRMRQAFLHLFVALLQARQRSGRLPESLAQLQASGYKPLEGLDLKRVVYMARDGKASLKFQLTAREMPYPQAGEEDPGMLKWRRLDGPDWILEIR